MFGDNLEKTRYRGLLSYATCLILHFQPESWLRRGRLVSNGMISSAVSQFQFLCVLVP